MGARHDFRPRGQGRPKPPATVLNCGRAPRASARLFSGVKARIVEPVFHVSATPSPTTSRGPTQAPRRISLSFLWLQGGKPAGPPTQVFGRHVCRQNGSAGTKPRGRQNLSGKGPYRRKTTQIRAPS